MSGRFFLHDRLAIRVHEATAPSFPTWRGGITKNLPNLLTGIFKFLLTPMGGMMYDM